MATWRTIWVEYKSSLYYELLKDGWKHYCDYVDEKGQARMVTQY